VSYNRSLGISSPALESVLVAMFDARTMWRQGMDLLEQHKVNEAIEKFENAESYDAEEPLYLCSQGMALLALPPAEDTNESIESLTDVAFSFDQDLVEAHILAANYMVRRNDYEAARTHIRKVLALDPDNREAKSFKQRSRVSQVGAQVSFKKKSESILDRALKLIKR
jgi:tetratricopeptide (TPR) repeat protein